MNLGISLFGADIWHLIQTFRFILLDDSDVGFVIRNHSLAHIIIHRLILLVLTKLEVSFNTIQTFTLETPIIVQQNGVISLCIITYAPNRPYMNMLHDTII